MRRLVTISLLFSALTSISQAQETPAPEAPAPPAANAKGAPKPAAKPAAAPANPVVAGPTQKRQIQSDESNCGFSLACANGADQFKLTFKSDSSDCSNDDVSATFEADGKSVPVGLPKAWYFFSHHLGKSATPICHDPYGEKSPFAVFSINENEVLFFLRASGRPGLDVVTALLMNSKTGEILDKKSVGRSKSDNTLVVKNKNGFKARLVRDSLDFDKELGCDCIDGIVDDWKEVSVVNSKIKERWLVSEKCAAGSDGN